MKKNLLPYLFIAGIVLMLTPSIQAQHTEYNISGGIGLFHYVTKQKQEPYYSMINKGSPSNYANVPYGNKNGLSYQFSFELKKITRHPFLWGLGLEYEDVKSRKKINWISDPYEFKSASGNVSLSNYFLALNPYIGYRFKGNLFYVDVMGGIDLAVSVSPARQQGTAIVDSTQKEINVNIRSRSYDGWDPFQTRARLQAEIGYKKFGLLLGYSRGLYKGHLATIGDKPLYSFSRYFRTGISYRLK